MPRYIDADALRKSEIERCHCVPLVGSNENDYKDLDEVLNDAPAADVVEIPAGGIGNLSDGYHTFNELYHHRAILFSVICNSMPDKAWKSKLHDTGDMFDGMFIVGIETPEGQATYHYDINPYWDMFKVKELEKAPKWDGHTPQDAIERIAKLSADVVEVRHGHWTDSAGNYVEFDEVNKGCPKGSCYCSVCGEWLAGSDEYPCFGHFCPKCGAKMDGERRE